MPTEYSKVENNFYSRFQSKYMLDPDLVKQFFMNAISEFEVEFSTLSFDEALEVIQEDLTNPEINLLGMLMYKSYLSRELDRILKLSNIVGRDISLTGMGDSKRTTQARYDSLIREINLLMSKIKDASYYE